MASRVPGSRWFRLGAALSVLTAIGHTLGNHTALAPQPTPEVAAVIARMREVTLPISGKSFWLGFVGDSLSLSVALAAYGLACLLFERASRRRGEPVPASVAAVGLVMTVAQIGIAARCFPPQPLVGAVVALAAYAIALVQVRRPAAA